MEHLWMISIFFWAGLWTFFWAAACGSPLLSLWSELQARFSGRSFFDKFGEQISRLGIVLWMIILVGCALCLGALLVCFPGLQLPRIHTCDLAVVMTPLLLGLLGFFPYALLWKRMKQHKGWHACLGMFSVLCLWLFIYLGLNFKLKIFLSGPGAAGIFNWQYLFQPPDFVFYWPFLADFFVLALGCAGVLGQLYLLVRRNKDDFGRDYYRFALPRAAGWSMFLGAQAAVWMVIGFLAQDRIVALLENPLFVGGIGVAILALVLAVVLWLIIMRAKAPMRFKGSIVAGNILAWLVLSSTWGVYFCLLSRELDVHLPFVSKLIQGLGLV